MPTNARENINGLTPQDLNKMNENFMSVWKTLYGGIDFDNTNLRTQNKINTQWITVQSEGNYDIGFPTYVRFYVPPDTKRVVSSSFNFLKERYRMDSGVANGGGGVEDVNIAMSMGNATGGISSIGGGGATSLSGGDISAYVNYWGNWNSKDPENNEQYYRIAVPSPHRLLYDDFKNSNITTIVNVSGGAPYGIHYREDGSLHTWLAPIYRGNANGKENYWLDLSTIQHKHEIPSHQHVLPAHSHDIVLEPHTHSAVGKVSLPPHTHELNEGIKVSSKDAGSTEIVLNGQTVGSMATGLNSINNLDLTEFIRIGEWNIIKISTNTLARITVYGVIEVIKG